jgi:hypothetical protein
MFFKEIRIFTSQTKEKKVRGKYEMHETKLYKKNDNEYKKNLQFITRLVSRKMALDKIKHIF